MSIPANRTHLFGNSGFARPAAVAAIMIVALALQSTLLSKLTLLGVVPQLLFVVVICLAYLEGEYVGVVVGFSAGFLLDLLIPLSLVGLTALVYTSIAFAVGSLRQFAASNSVWLPVFAVAISSTIAEGGYALLSIMMGQRWVGLAYTGKIIGLVALYNTLLTPFVFPVVKKIADRYRPERVVRF